MSNYRVSVIGGWCGNRLYIVADHLSDKFEEAGLECRVKSHSVWENYSFPPASSDLVLQLLPAFTAADTGCPVINIKPLLRDLDDPDTMEKIFTQVRADLAQLNAPARASL